MTLLDMVVLFVLFMGLWQGFNNGLMRSLVGMFGWLLALLLASYLAKPLAPFFVSLTGSTPLSIIAAFLAIGLFVIVGLQIVLWVMSKTLQGLRLSILDKLAGAGFGLVKNLVIVLMVLSLLAPLSVNVTFGSSLSLPMRYCHWHLLRHKSPNSLLPRSVKPLPIK